MEVSIYSIISQLFRLQVTLFLKIHVKDAMQFILTQKMLYNGELAGELLHYYNEAHDSPRQEIIVMWVVVPHKMDLPTILEYV